MRGFITARDYRLMRRVHRWDAPEWVRVWMVCATRGGDGWLWYGIGALLFVIGGPRRFDAIAAAALASAAGVALFLFVKKHTARKRPCHIEPHRWSTLLPPDQFSFPSGHTISAFAVSVALAKFYPELWPVLMFCAGNIAVSRIVLGMHFLSDVVAGGIIGSGLGYAAARVLGG